jgi:tetratricopeptide (TPR) repeat protein
MRKFIAMTISPTVIVFLFFSCASPTEQGTGEQAGPETAVDSVLLSRYPDSIALRLKLSSFYESRGDISGALRVITSGIERDSLQPICWNRKASLLLSMQDTTGAIGSLLRSLTIAPDQTDILLELGFIYADRRDPAAIAVAERILSPEGDPRFHTEAYYLKGIYLGNIGEYDEAIRSYDGAIRSSYTFTDAYIEKGILLFDQGKIADAHGVFEKVLTVNNSLADGYYWRGRCHESSGRKTAALEDFRRALSLDPNLMGAHKGEIRLSK